MLFLFRVSIKKRGIAPLNILFLFLALGGIFSGHRQRDHNSLLLRPAGFNFGPYVFWNRPARASLGQWHGSSPFYRIIAWCGCMRNRREIVKLSLALRSSWSLFYAAIMEGARKIEIFGLATGFTMLIDDTDVDCIKKWKNGKFPDTFWYSFSLNMLKSGFFIL